MGREDASGIQSGVNGGADVASLLSKVVANAPIVLFAIDRNGIFTLSEGRALIELGLVPGEVVGRSVFDVYAGSPEVIDAVERALNGEDFMSVVRVAGRTFESHYYTVFGDRGEASGLVGVAIDISDKSRLEEEQIRLSKLESLGLLAGGIAHDFNNTLSAILMNVGLAKSDAAVASSQARLRLDAVETECDIARGLTRQLMVFARGGVQTRASAELSEIVADSVAFALSGSSAIWEAHLEPSLWLINVDEAQIRQVLGNLIINASQSMPWGGVITIRAENAEIGEEEIESHLPLELGRYVKVIVEDQGCGIDPSIIERVIDPYFTTKPAGTGLGLATAHSIVAAHGGRLSVSSEVGRGTTVVLHLPACPDKPVADPALDHDAKDQASDADPSGADAKEEPIGVGADGDEVDQGGGSRILVMDDEPGVRDVLRLALGSAGYRIDLARDGDEVIDLYRRSLESGDRYSGVIMDLEVKAGLGGVEALRAILDLDPAARVIVSSGYTRDPAVADYASFGFVGALAKPYTVSELRRVISQVAT